MKKQASLQPLCATSFDHWRWRVMDSVLPVDFPLETMPRRGASDAASAKRKGHRTDRYRDDDSTTIDAVVSHLPMTAVSGQVRYGVVRLSAAELVVESEGRVPMRGTVDLFAGGERIGRMLVQFAWERDGRTGYELKRRSMRLPTGATPHGAR
ncbi:MAG: hypothetical protein AAFT19_02500 [Pseudomonadota bacterium]